MNARKRFIETFRFNKNISPPRLDTIGFWDSTIKRWHQEGLPRNKTPEEYFGMDKVDYVPEVSHYLLPVEPVFKKNIIEDNDEYSIYVNERGVIEKEFKKTLAQEAKDAMPQWLEFPVKSRKDFEDIKWRLDPELPERYPDWETVRTKYHNRGFPLGLMITGGYAIGRELMGMEKLAVSFYDDPGLIRDIISFWLGFEKKVIEITASNIDFDFVYIWEDMAYKGGPLISPSLFSKYIKDSYIELTRHIRDLGCPNIIVDSDGNNDALLSIFIETGVNGFLPVEAAAGMDPLEIRKKHGESLMMWGGIDKRVLSKTKKDIEKEVLSKVPFLLKTGGYIPSVDHSTPPDVSFDNFSFFIEILRELIKYE